MRKICNPFPLIWQDEYCCFGCSPDNANGLKLRFYDTGDGLMAHWQPKQHFIGYPGIIHGGIQATLLDEIAAWTVYVKCETSGVTQDMKITFHQPLRISKGEAIIKARLLEKTDRNAILIAELFDGEGKLCSEAKLNYYIYPQAIAVKRFNYPGIDAFYKYEE